MTRFSKETKFGVSTLRHLYDAGMKKPIPPPIPVECGLCIKEKPYGVSGTNMCFSQTEEIKGVRCYRVSKERVLIPD